MAGLAVLSLRPSRDCSWGFNGEIAPEKGVELGGTNSVSFLSSDFFLILRKCHILFNNNDDEEFSVTVWDPRALSCQGARCPAWAFGRHLR